MDINFQRYLTAKKTVDDRALNRVVWAEMARRLPPAPTVVEIACGVGTMYTRLHEWGLLTGAGGYLGIDSDPENIRTAAGEEYPGMPAFRCADLFDVTPVPTADLLVAAAFLDLVPLDVALPHLAGFIKPGGLAYFPINFDGLSLFSPADPNDEVVLEAYHRSMDERAEGGDSRTGRSLFEALPAAGFEVLSAGSSDWVVHPVNGLYTADEAYFLYHILHFFRTSCAGATGLEGWLETRRSQIENGTLVFIAHQYDFLVRRK